MELDEQRAKWEGKPFAWIQWKGTDVCMDIHCPCTPDAIMHLDQDYAYYVKCPYCGQLYQCDGHISLHPVDTIEGGMPDYILLEKDEYYEA